MTAITCPHCSRVGKLKNAVPIGATVRCPGCQERFSVLAGYQNGVSDEVDQAADLGIDLDGTQRLDRGVALDEIPAEVVALPAPLPGPDLAPSSASSAASADPDQKTATAPARAINQWHQASVPPEPWFYRWLVGVAGFFWIVGIILSVPASIVAVLFVFLLPALAAESDPGRVVAVRLLIIITEVLTVSSIFTTSALLQLAVDHARNVRATRFQLQAIAEHWPPVTP